MMKLLLALFLLLNAPSAAPEGPALPIKEVHCEGEHFSLAPIEDASGPFYLLVLDGNENIFRLSSALIRPELGLVMARFHPDSNSSTTLLLFLRENKNEAVYSSAGEHRRIRIECRYQTV